MAEQPPRLRKLEQLSEAIAQQQGKFAEQVSQCEELQETLETNAENAERQLGDPLLIAQRTRVDELWVAPLRLKARQAETDLRHLSITQSQAERIHHSIEMLAQVRAGRWSRSTTILLGVFAVFGLLQVFPEILQLPLGWRVGLSILLPVLTAAALLFIKE